jgi:hypothetical protein
LHSGADIEFSPGNKTNSTPVTDTLSADNVNSFRESHDGPADNEQSGEPVEKKQSSATEAASDGPVLIQKHPGRNAPMSVYSKTRRTARPETRDVPIRIIGSFNPVEMKTLELPSEPPNSKVKSERRKRDFDMRLLELSSDLPHSKIESEGTAADTAVKSNLKSMAARRQRTVQNEASGQNKPHIARPKGIRLESGAFKAKDLEFKGRTIRDASRAVMQS